MIFHDLGNSLWSRIRVNDVEKQEVGSGEHRMRMLAITSMEGCGYW